MGCPRVCWLLKQMGTMMPVVTGSSPAGIYRSRWLLKPIPLWEACSDNRNDLNSSKL
jgi:hypothetical protein